MDNKKIGLFISKLRKEQGFSQKELAEKLSVTDKAVSKWETGRGIPDVSILQPLANIFDVTVGEILNGERMPQQQNNDEQLIKKLKIKRYIRLAVEFIITAVFAYWIYIFYDTFNGYRNVIDLYLHTNEIRFLSICTLIFIAIAALWTLTFIISAIFRKKAAIIKTIIICLSISFTVGSAVQLATLEDNRALEMYDSPIDTISYIKYDDFFDDEFETQISIKDTNDKITGHYSAYFNSTLEAEEYNFVNTNCVTACDYDITKAYFDEKKSILTNNTTYVDMNKKLCKSLGVNEGYYITGNYSDKDIRLCFIKGTSCYDIEISNANINDKKLVEKIVEL